MKSSHAFNLYLIKADKGLITTYIILHNSDCPFKRSKCTQFIRKVQKNDEYDAEFSKN